MSGLEAELDVLIEIPRGCRNKYEWDPHKKLIRLDRVLYSSVHYPTDYGMAPETVAEDGDPLDVLVVVEEPTFPGCLVRARAIGTLDMRDEKGIDHKILAVPTGDPRFDQVFSLEDLPTHWLKEIETFFATYKALEGVQTEVLGWHGLDQALEVISKARLRYLAQAEGKG